MRRNGGTRQAHGSGKLYRKAVNCLNSWMNTRKYAMISIIVTMSPKGVHYAQTRYGYVYRNGLASWEETGFEEDELDTVLTKALQSTEVLHISTPCTSVTHKVITSGESCTHTG